MNISSKYIHFLSPLLRIIHIGIKPEKSMFGIFIPKKIIQLNTSKCLFRERVVCAACITYFSMYGDAHLI